MSFNVVEIKKGLDNCEMKLVDKMPQLKAIKVMTGIPAIYFVLGAVFLCFILFWLLSGFRAMVHLVAFIYPAWQSLKALDTQNRDDDTLWMSYWVIYSFCTVFESITDFLVHRIPFYELVKMCFYLYLYEKRGAIVVYENFLRPFVRKFEKVDVHAKVHAENVNQGPSQGNQANFSAQVNANTDVNQGYNNPTTSRNTRKQNID